MEYFLDFTFSVILLSVMSKRMMEYIWKKASALMMMKSVDKIHAVNWTGTALFESCATEPETPRKVLDYRI